MMKIVALVFSIITVQAYVIDEIVDLNGCRYLMETLHYKSVFGSSVLEVDYSTNYLYFTDDSQAWILNFRAQDVNPILRITNVTAISLDQIAHIVYIGTTDGIYIHNVNQWKNNITKLIDTEGKSILNMYFKDGLYYSDNSSQNFYTFVDGNSSQIIEIDHLDTFVIDNEDNMFFISGNNLYRQKKDAKEVIVYKGAPVGRGIAADRDGKIYYCAKDGIYEVIKDKAIVKQIFSLYNPLHITFDNENNMIYSDSGKIYRLIPILETYKQLESIGKKIDNLANKIDKLGTVILEDRLHHTEKTPRNIQLHIQDINITISLNTTEVKQMIP